MKELPPELCTVLALIRNPASTVPDIEIWSHYWQDTFPRMRQTPKFFPPGTEQRDTQELLPDLCLGCGAVRGQPQLGGRIRYTCRQCKTPDWIAHTKMTALSMHSICREKEVEYLLLYSWMQTHRG